jgi:hypothetical protein
MYVIVEAPIIGTNAYCSILIGSIDLVVIESRSNGIVLIIYIYIYIYIYKVGSMTKEGLPSLRYSHSSSMESISALGSSSIHSSLHSEAESSSPSSPLNLFDYPEEDLYNAAAPTTVRFTHYEILHLPVHATPDQIKKAYRRLSLKYHPDKTGRDQNDYGACVLVFVALTIDPSIHQKSDAKNRKNRVRLLIRSIYFIVTLFSSHCSFLFFSLSRRQVCLRHSQ